MNALCRRLWRYAKTPGIAEVRNAWEEYVSQQGIWITNDLSYLTLNRRKVIAALAHQPVIEVQGQEFSKRVGLNPSGIKKCIVDLQKLDMIHIDKAGYYRVLDPAVAYFIRNKN